jgi:hypothetical protein
LNLSGATKQKPQVAEASSSEDELVNQMARALAEKLTSSSDITPFSSKLTDEKHEEQDEDEMSSKRRKSTKSSSSSASSSASSSSTSVSLLSLLEKSSAKELSFDSLEKLLQLDVGRSLLYCSSLFPS